MKTWCLGIIMSSCIYPVSGAQNEHDDRIDRGLCEQIVGAFEPDRSSKLFACAEIVQEEEQSYIAYSFINRDGESQRFSNRYWIGKLLLEDAQKWCRFCNIVFTAMPLPRASDIRDLWNEHQLGINNSIA